MSDKNLYKKLIQKVGGDGTVLLVSFLLAIVVWCLLKFSASYSSNYHYKVELTTSMPGRSFSSVSSGAVVVRGKSSGFTIIKHRIVARKNKNILHFSASPAIFRQVKGSDNTFYVLTNVLKENIISKLSEQISVDGISMDTLFFVYNRTASKRVPVALKTDLSYTDQFMPFEKLRSNPDSIEIQGEMQLLSKIDSVETELIRRRNLHQDLQGSVKIKAINGVRFSEENIYYSQKIGRYYEGRVSLPVATAKVPSGYSMIISPSDVTIIFRVDYNIKKEFGPADFYVYADYDQVANSMSGKAKINLREIPTGVYGVHLEPQFADAIILNLSDPEK